MTSGSSGPASIASGYLRRWRRFHTKKQSDPLGSGSAKQSSFLGQAIQRHVGRGRLLRVGGTTLDHFEEMFGRQRPPPNKKMGDVGGAGRVFRSAIPLGWGGPGCRRSILQAGPWLNSLRLDHDLPSAKLNLSATSAATALRFAAGREPCCRPALSPRRRPT